MHVGITRRRVMQGLVVHLAIGVAALVLGGIAVLLDRDPANDPSPARRAVAMAVLLAAPAALWLLLAGALGSVTLRLEGGRVEQVLWRRFVLRREPIAHLTGVTGGAFAALVLHFRGRRRLALPAIHAEDRHAFVAALDELRPELGLLDAE